MILDDIQNGESEKLEFKAETPSDDKKYLKTAVAFANGAGGTLVFGVKNNGEIIGIPAEEVLALRDGVTDSISDNISPQLVPSVLFQTVNDKTLMLVQVSHGQNTPYYIKKEGPVDGVYIRVEATTRKAEPEKVQELILLGTHRYYDEVVQEKTPVRQKDIDALCAAIKRYNGEHRDVTLENLVSWRLLQREGESLYPTVAFRLLTYNDLYFARVQCALFKGTDKVEFLDRKEFEGPVYEQIENAYTFVLQHINKGAVIKGLLRRDVYELPPAAIRELIVNAVMHRNYLVRSNVQVSIFDDRIEILSPGSLFNGLTKEEMLSGYSSVRNRLLSDTLQRMDIVEKWGTGIQRIFKLCDEANTARPVYTVSPSMLRVEFYRRENYPVNAGTTLKTTPKSGDTTLKTTPKPDDTTLKILALIEKNPYITREQLAAECGISIDGIKWQLKQLKGTVQHVGSRRAGRWQIIDNNKETTHAD